MSQLFRVAKGRACLAGHAFFLVCVATGAAVAQPSGDGWDLRFCADPDAWPFSSSSEPGFENEIAQIIAEELGATLSVDWSRQNDAMIRDRLNGGECDVIAGVPDEIEGLEHTITYYTSPYVFVHRADLDLSGPLTLDLPDLADMRIGVQVAAMPPHEALLNRGLNDNVVFEGLNALAGGDPASVLDELEAGGIDVALAWGPVAGAWLVQHDGYEMTPVTPEFELPFLQQVVPMTMAVRLGDLSLRDDLNAAIAARWDDIEAVLADYGVPVAPAGAPGMLEPQPAPATLAIITPADIRPAPISTALYSLAGEAAQRGALLAAEELIRQDGDAMELLRAVTPTAAAAERAAARIANLHQPAALIGGVGPGQLQALAATGLPVINVGEPAAEEVEGVFHAQATRDMYLEAMIAWFGADGERWYVLHEASAQGQDLRDAFESALERVAPDAVIAGSSAVPPAHANFGPIVDEAAQTADVVAVLLDPRDQISFLAQMGGSELKAAPYPHAVGQTRDYLASVAARAGLNGSGEHLVLFEPREPQSQDANAAYAARWGAPMEPGAWSAWRAVHTVAEAIAQEGEDWTGGLSHYLFCEPGTETVDLPVVRLDPQVRWEPTTLAGVTNVVEPVGSVAVSCP